MFQDATLQIFLTIYHGSLIGTFFFDYIIRNAVRWFTNGLQWQYIANVALGVVLVAVIIWAILSVWSKIRRNLIISLVVLIVIFVIRLAIGIPEMIDQSKAMGSNNKQFTENLAIFIAQMVVHLLGVIATWFLANNS